MGLKESRYWARQYKIRKLRAIEYKGGKCQRCPYDKCPAALEFHHRDPNGKEFEWNKMRRRRWSEVLIELDKCDLLCSNCHREVHYDSKLWDAIIEWRDDIDARKIAPKFCKTCGKVFRPAANSVAHCSFACGAQSQEKIAWPKNLPELVAASSKLAVARSLGVSDKSVSRRLVRHHKEVLVV